MTFPIRPDIDGSNLMVVRDVGGKARLEFPMGKVLYETSGHISYARLSPKADRIVRRFTSGVACWALTTAV